MDKITIRSAPPFLLSTGEQRAATHEAGFGCKVSRTDGVRQVVEIKDLERAMGTRKAIFHIPGATFGGAHNQLLAGKSLLEDLSIEPVCILPDEPGNAASRIEEGGVKVIRMAHYRPRRHQPVRSLIRVILNFPKQVRALRSLMDSSDVAFVQVHGILNLDVTYAAFRSKVPIVWEIIDTRPPKPLRWVISPLVLWWADQILVTGRTVGGMYPGILRDKKTHTFLPPPNIGSARRHANQYDEPLRVGGLGNLNPQKGFENLIAAIAQLRNTNGRFAQVQLIIRGAFDPAHETYRLSLIKQLENAGLPSNTLGPLATTSDEFLSTLDVFVLPSVGRSEGIPTVVLEAIEVGVPVVATNVGGVAEIIEDGVTGWLADPGNSVALANAIESALADPIEAGHRSRRALETLVQRYQREGFHMVHTNAYIRYSRQR